MDRSLNRLSSGKKFYDFNCLSSGNRREEPTPTQTAELVPVTTSEATETTEITETTTTEPTPTPEPTGKPAFEGKGTTTVIEKVVTTGSGSNLSPELAIEGTGGCSLNSNIAGSPSAFLWMFPSLILSMVTWIRRK